MTLNLLTWNIKVLDGDCVRYADIARQMCSAQPDVICLQEVSVIGWHYIKAFINEYYESVYDSPLRANSTYRSYGEMILFKRGQFQVTNKGFFLLPSKMGRSVQWACLTDACGESTIVSTGHLESESNNAPARSKQWIKIMNEFKNMNYPIVWAGDTNMEEGEEEPSYGEFVKFGDTYFGYRFGYDGTGAYDNVWTVGKEVTLVNRIGLDKNNLALSDHDGIIIRVN